MASVNRKSLGGALVMLVITAVLVYFGTCLFPHWPLTRPTPRRPLAAALVRAFAVTALCSADFVVGSGTVRVSGVGPGCAQ